MLTRYHIRAVFDEGEYGVWSEPYQPFDGQDLQPAFIGYGVYAYEGPKLMAQGEGALFRSVSDSVDELRKLRGN